ncbi:MAG: response regulator [Caulobacteraceae bacterium]|nr:response regulator [Caulobacteraceae bacterium]
MAELIIETRNRPAQLLLVEDNADDVFLARDAFRAAKLKNRLAVATTGEEALDRLRRQGDGPHTPDLILLDLNLPDMDGRTLLQRIRALPSLRRPTVIALVACEAEAGAVRAEVDADAVLAKPIDVDRLADTVGRLAAFEVKRGRQARPPPGRRRREQ